MNIKDLILVPVLYISASHVRGRANLIPTSLGQGKDYFEEMFRDLKRQTSGSIPKLPSPPAEPTLTSSAHGSGSYQNGEYVEQKQEGSVDGQQANMYTSK